MLRFLAKVFIKDYTNYQNPAVRASYGVLCGVTGIVLNLLLFSAKLVAGLLCKSVSVVADAVNNASDMASSLVTIVGFKVSQKKADEDHPFGHGRMEYIASLIVSFFILMFGWELLRTSISGLKEQKSLDTSIFTIIILIASIAVKFYMYFYNKSIGKSISSTALAATARDSLNDTITTFVALVAVAIDIFLKKAAASEGAAAGNFPLSKATISALQKIPFDSIAGGVVAIFIIYGGVRCLMETVDPLLGAKTDKAFIDAVKARLLTHKYITGVHDFIAHDYGAGRVMISVHAEVPGDEDIFTLHEAIDHAETDIAKHFGCAITIHMDPVDTKCAERIPLTQYITKAAQSLDLGLSIHDLRLITGVKRTNVVFDAVPSTKCKMSDKDLRSALSNIVKDWPKAAEYKNFSNGGARNYVAVIHIDSPFF